MNGARKRKAILSGLIVGALAFALVAASIPGRAFVPPPPPRPLPSLGKLLKGPQIPDGKVVRTPAGPVCSSCLLLAVEGAISLIRVPAVKGSGAKYTFVNTNGKLTTWQAPAAGSQSNAAAATTSTATNDGPSVCDTGELKCYHADQRADLAKSGENSDVRVYGVITAMLPTFDTGNTYFVLIYMTSTATPKRSGVKVRGLVDRVTETQAASSFITDYNPNGSHEYGAPKTQGFTIGASYKGTGITIGRTWTSVIGWVEGQAPANGGKEFTGDWDGKFERSVPFIGGATYRVTGESSVFHYTLYMLYEK